MAENQKIEIEIKDIDRLEAMLVRFEKAVEKLTQSVIPEPKIIPAITAEDLKKRWNELAESVSP